ncbi:alpha/beta-hydrolases superfamily protein [Anaeramoeba flamelloides]|uniref:Alpha/beta-hydrolases superfamily protein n=1 Tax=Anaeramoeba flamelloides TaxID=1746091 RepID=A0ABQ8XHF7_9EUKA|nr:alpha/beta-hydrolases superfamily protein [Anaeramoeba flamelloides]
MSESDNAKTQESNQDRQKIQLTVSKLFNIFLNFLFGAVIFVFGFVIFFQHLIFYSFSYYHLSTISPDKIDDVTDLIPSQFLALFGSLWYFGLTSEYIRDLLNLRVERGRTSGKWAGLRLVDNRTVTGGAMTERLIKSSDPEEIIQEQIKKAHRGHKTGKKIESKELLVSDSLSSMSTILSEDHSNSGSSSEGSNPLTTTKPDRVSYKPQIKVDTQLKSINQAIRFVSNFFYEKKSSRVLGFLAKENFFNHYFCLTSYFLLFLICFIVTMVDHEGPLGLWQLWFNSCVIPHLVGVLILAIVEYLLTVKYVLQTAGIVEERCLYDHELKQNKIQTIYHFQRFKKKANIAWLVLAAVILVWACVSCYRTKIAGFDKFLITLSNIVNIPILFYFGTKLTKSLKKEKSRFDGVAKLAIGSKIRRFFSRYWRIFFCSVAIISSALVIIFSVLQVFQRKVTGLPTIIFLFIFISFLFSMIAIHARSIPNWSKHSLVWGAILALFFVLWMIALLGPVKTKLKNDDLHGDYPWCDFIIDDEIDMFNISAMAYSAYEVGKDSFYEVMDYALPSNWRDWHLETYSNYTKWFLLHNNNTNSYYIAIAGTEGKRFISVITDGYYWSSIASFQMFNMVYPYLHLSNSKTLAVIMYILTRVVDLYYPSMNSFYDEVLHRVESIIQNADPDNPPKIIITGHSLGGGIAEIVASSFESEDLGKKNLENNIKAVTFNAPGIFYSRKKFLFLNNSSIFLDNINRNSIGVKVEYDPVGMIDKAAGNVQHIQCTQTNSLECHFLKNTILTLWDGCNKPGTPKFLL